MINHNKPGKIRIVWDAAAKVKNVSLNSFLLKGPDQLKPLVAVLFRFRERKFAVCADIREMFHRVLIRDDDKHVQRFLWRNNPSCDYDIYVMNVMSFGAKCSPSMAQFVKNTNAERFLLQHPRAVQAIVENHYVDDWLDSVDTENEAIQLAIEVRTIHSEGGFEIRNWVSNSVQVVEKLGGAHSNEIKCLNLSPEVVTEKVLGICWSTSSDCFLFSPTINRKISQMIADPKHPTKRQVLQILMTVFDPMGLLGHFMIYLKILLQRIWRSRIIWDEEITDEQNKHWRHWLNLIPQIESLRVPRWYGTLSNTKPCDVQLHIFADASAVAYATVAYFRIETDDGVSCILIGSKTRVAPLKLVSIPRLELQAAVLGTRFAATIIESHTIQISSTYYWTDSKTVVSWLRADHRRYKQFVAFRVGEILESTDPCQWRWISTKLNVADDATKWEKNPKFENEARWFKGPPFLCLPIEEWPVDISEANVLQLTPESFEEIRPHLHHSVRLTQHVIPVEDFSCWWNLIRRHALVFRFINKCRVHASQPRKLKTFKSFALNRDEYQNAERYLYRLAQRDGFPEEISVLKNNSKTLSKSQQGNDQKREKQYTALSKNSAIRKSSPYLDEYGVMRASGRLNAASYVPLDVKSSIILPKDHWITQLIITEYHKRYHHHNKETVINELQQRYHIPRMRTVVQKVIKNCPSCKITSATPRPPKMADLPPARLQAFCRPFTASGIDFFGPLLVTIGRRSEKRWGVLITCLTTRAIHIEVAHSLSTDSCILSLKNFTNRRGMPNDIYSDNGTNFHGCERELRAALASVDKEALMREFTTPNTQWHFNPPSCPHMGGSWERLVRSVKNTLYRIQPRRNPNDELLLNMMIEIENTINSRPLTYVPVDSETPEALTPNHLLLGSSNGSKPLCDVDDSGIIFRKNWLTSQQFANQFWKRWLVEYLPTITRRSKWFNNVKPIDEGDLVLIIDAKNPRNCYPMGRVVKTIVSKDGQVRRATVKTKTGIYERPTVKLAVLDIGLNDDGKPLNGTAIPGGNVAMSPHHNSN